MTCTITGYYEGGSCWFLVFCRLYRQIEDTLASCFHSFNFLSVNFRQKNRFMIYDLMFSCPAVPIKRLYSSSFHQWQYKWNVLKLSPQQFKFVTSFQHGSVFHHWRFWKAFRLSFNTCSEFCDRCKYCTAFCLDTAAEQCYLCKLLSA